MIGLFALPVAASPLLASCGPPPFVFPKPAIIRPATADLLRHGDPAVGMLFAPGLRAANRSPLDLISSGTLTGAWSMSRKLRGAYNGAFFDQVSSAVSTLYDQSGNGRNFTQGTAGNRPGVITAGTKGRAAADFDGTNDYLVGTTLSNLISVSSGYVVISFIANTIGTNDATIYQNDAAWFVGTDPPDTNLLNNYAGVPLRSGSGGTPFVYNYDTNADSTSLSGGSAGVALEMVIPWLHTGGNLSGRVNLGTTTTITSGNTNGLAGSTFIGVNPRSSGPYYADITVFEMVAFSTPPSSGDRNILEQALLDWIH